MPPQSTDPSPEEQRRRSTPPETASGRKLDTWIRMRDRYMQTRRKGVEDNCKIRVKAFRLGLLTLGNYSDAALSKRTNRLPARGDLLRIARCLNARR